MAGRIPEQTKRQWSPVPTAQALQRTQAEQIATRLSTNIVFAGTPVVEERLTDNAILLLEGEHGGFRFIRGGRLIGVPGTVVMAEVVFGASYYVVGVTFNALVTVQGGSFCRFVDCRFEAGLTTAAGSSSTCIACTSPTRLESVVMVPGEWQDAVLPATRIGAAPGTNPPAYDPSRRKHRFPVGQNRDLDLGFEPGHGYREGTAVQLHFHCIGSVAAAGNVRYIITVRDNTPGYAEMGWIVRAAATFPMLVTNLQQIVTLDTYLNPLTDIGTDFQYNLQLARNNIADTYPGDIYVSTYGIHFQAETIGSTTVSAK